MTPEGDIQIFGSDPTIMAEAARRVEEAGADILDINFGCSVKKVVKTASGVALMKEPKRAEIILKAVRNAIKIPLTIKIRTGWDPSGEQAFRIAAMAEHCGVNAISFHPRTAQQGFGGKANWSLIAELKDRLSIPLIGNGDITSAEDALRMFQETRCDGVMIGRASMSDPVIFRDTAFLLGNRNSSPRSIADHFAMLEQFIDDSVACHGEKFACRMLRSRLGWLVKGFSGAANFRKNLSHISTRAETLQLIHTLRDSLL